MSSSEQRLAANRTNARSSTGPITERGKSIAARNATRHGLLSTRVLLDDEDAAEFQRLIEELMASLHPADAVERILVERIAVTVWRQQRLVRAETAKLTLARQPLKIAGVVNSELERGYAQKLGVEDLSPFDRTQERWCRRVVAEIDALEDFDLGSLQQKAPLTYGQLASDAAEDQETPEAHAAARDGGLAGYIVKLSLWCRKELAEAEARPQILALAEHARARNVVLPVDALETFSRYQTTLDNQLYKALKALREAQGWRLKTLEASPQSVELDQEAAVDHDCFGFVSQKPDG
jgi:hypothetical protein